MTSRKLAARALKFLPAIVIAVAAFVQVRTQVTLARTRAQPGAVTFLRGRPQPSHVSGHIARPRRAAL